ncbi:FAD-binding protein [Ramlibacter sp. G-1-2-2]|uniref:FAD-binding protein n=1 Tax=Ramlibacter agri TaxID=2728837 RepID=A0A848GW11_9BURK|nr:FAD-binding protein [Ramlibacter agri]NML42836.1 FAD-binding protein [Ramlibacter agri]
MQGQIVNDVTGLNPVPVFAIHRPRSVDEVVEAIRRYDGAVSVGGGHFSMGGQTASPGSLHLDMRQMNRVLGFSPVDKTIRVQAGIRWCDIQRFVDPHDLSVKIMQTYANFTVGGSLSVNVHGRYMGLGPVILSVRWFKLVLADGTVAQATPEGNPELFHAVIGGYGGLGVIVEVELALADNVKVKRVATKLSSADYYEHFRAKVRNSPDAVFHNADLYPPHYDRARSVTWVRTDEAVTEPRRLHRGGAGYALERYFVWAVTETPLGKWRREHLIDPLLYASRKVHWRNFEASYDAAELEPASRKRTTYVLQEYFVPVEKFTEFVPRMAEVLRRHRVNALNVSVRHAQGDPGSLMAWARGETFAFVLYYKQRTRDNAKNRVAIWTRELIDAVLSVGGCYYLPYQPHATPEQFHAAYPRARELFALKRRLDPRFRFRNVLWDKYYAEPAMTPAAPSASEFRTVYGELSSHDAFYKFLQNIYRLYPEDRFHTLIKDSCERLDSDEAIYRQLQRDLPAIKPFHADLTYALPSLFKQKQEMARQTLELLESQRDVDGYLEIGSTGRYISELRKHLRVKGPVVLVNDVAPGWSPVDIVERGGLRKIGEFVPMADYSPLPDTLPAGGFQVVTCYIGLHHCPLDKLDAFVRSIVRVLAPGGLFILRDHDVKGKAMDAFVSLAHTVFNAGLGVPWSTNAAELRHFRPLDEWIAYLGERGLRHTGPRLLQAHDPSDNVLLAFRKEAA